MLCLLKLLACVFMCSGYSWLVLVAFDYRNKTSVTDGETKQMAMGSGKTIAYVLLAVAAFVHLILCVLETQEKVDA